MKGSQDKGADLWCQFIKSVQPLKKTVQAPFQNSKDEKKRISRHQPVVYQHYPEASIPSTPSPLDRRPKGKPPVLEARLDLHGETLKQAYFVLNRFIERSVQRSCGVVLVITGKSLRKSDTPGVRLVDMVPVWLRTPPLNQWVKKVIQAKPRDGGGGALYVYLRF